MHRLPDMRAWMNKNAELQEKFNNGTLFEENQKIREEKEKAQREQDERIEKLSTSKQPEATQTKSDNSISSEQTNTALSNELTQWQQDLSIIKSSQQNEPPLKSEAVNELKEQIKALKELNDRLITGLEDNRQKYEDSQKVITDSFSQIIENKNTQISTLDEKYNELEKSYDELVANYNTLQKTRNRENSNYRSRIDELEIKSTDLEAKLEKIYTFVSKEISDNEIVKEVGIILGKDTTFISTTNSLFENSKTDLDTKAQITSTPKIPVKEIIITRLEGPSAECDIERKAYSFHEANYKIKEMSKNAPKHGGYDKVRFSVTFSDNLDNDQEKIYTGRIDMMHYTVEKNSREQNIEQHIHDHLSFYNGTLKPDHMSQTQYDDFLSKNTTKESRQEINEFLDKYIPDEAKHPKVQSREQELSNQQSEVKTKEADRHQDKAVKSTSNEQSKSQSVTQKSNQQTKDKSKSKGGDGGLGY